MWVALIATLCFGPILGALMASLLGGVGFWIGGLVAGFYVAVFCSPVVVLAFFRKRAWPAILIPFGVTLAAGLISLAWQSVPATLYVPLITLCASSVIMRPFVASVRRRYPTGHCRRCGYDLTGNVSGRCSECGLVISSRSEQMVDAS